MLENVTDLTRRGASKGLNTSTDFIGMDKDYSPNMMNVKVEFNGPQSKRLGSDTRNSIIIATSSGTTWTVDGAGTLTSNLQAFWKLDEASGDRSDVFGGHVLTDINNVGQSGGIRGSAANFVGSNSGALSRATTSTLVSGDSDFSISTWVYLNSLSVSLDRVILSKRDELSADSSNVMLVHFNGPHSSTAISDLGRNRHAFNVAGDAKISTTQYRFGGASLRLNGAGDFIYVSDHDDFFFGVSDLTIECFSRFDTTTANRSIMGQDPAANEWWSMFWVSSSNAMRFVAASNGTYTHNLSWNWTPGTATWYHIAVVRSSNNWTAYIDGSGLGLISNGSSLMSYTDVLRIGRTRSDFVGTLDGMVGYHDEIRMSKGVARYSADFTSMTSENGASDYEYSLLIDSDNIAVWRVSSSGISADGTIRATSFGALGTSTWYNIVAWHDTGNFLGISVNLATNSASYALGVRGGTANFMLGSVTNNLGSFFDGRIDETGFWRRVLTAQNRTDLYNGGSGNTYSRGFGNEPWASFDFGATSIRWLTVAAGTGIYASSNLGVTWVNIATDRTATYQYLDRSKNVLIATSDNYDRPLFWAGSANTFAAMLNVSAPLAKYSINFQGFSFLFNTAARKRGLFYEDENTQLTGSYSSNFDIPSTQDDELTTAFILRRYMYLSTRYYLYRVNYVGGNPDFAYLKVKDWGYVPRTVRPIYIEGVGEVVCGLGWDLKLRVFDGSEDKIISGPIEQNNGLCDFSLSKVGRVGTGLIVSFAETDYNENVYKLCVALGQESSQTTHFINFEGRSQAFYPYSRMPFNTMTMAESANLRYLMAFDRSGRCHMMDSGNLDGNTTAVDDILDSAITFDKSPAESHEGYQTHLFFSNLTCGRIYYQDRANFDLDFIDRENFVISGSDRKIMIHKVIDVPENYNAYQFRITSSASTSNPWRLVRTDHFTKGHGIGMVK